MFDAEEDYHTSTAKEFRTVPMFACPPRVKEIIDAPDIERGAIDARRTRIVSSTRFAARKGADRQVKGNIPHESDDSCM
jgi:hypothetical protein